MSTLWIDLPTARRLPLALSRLGEDAGVARTYVKDNTELYYGEGVINKLRGGHEDVVYAITQFLWQIQRRTVGTTFEKVTEALWFYEKTEVANAAALDAAGPQAYVDRRLFADFYRTSGDPTAFTDRYEPQGRLSGFPDYNKADEFQYEPALWDLSSPTSLARDAIWGATALAAKLGILDRAYDPFEELSSPGFDGELVSWFSGVR